MPLRALLVLLLYAITFTASHPPRRRTARTRLDLIIPLLRSNTIVVVAEITYTMRPARPGASRPTTRITPQKAGIATTGQNCAKCGWEKRSVPSAPCSYCKNQPKNAKDPTKNFRFWVVCHVCEHDRKKAPGQKVLCAHCDNRGRRLLRCGMCKGTGQTEASRHCNYRDCEYYGTDDGKR